LILSGTGSFPSGILMNTLLKPAQSLMRFVSKLIPPVRIRLPITSSLSNDPEVVKAYKNDPLVIKTITPQLAMEMINPIFDIKNFIGKFRLPLLIQGGSKDLIVTGLPVLKSALKMEDQTVIVYKGLKHEVYNEVEKDREQVLNDLANWLNKYL
jgi:alpha-beta hydrolase superfamily lysophospholipase